jgi:hypothetical protein
LIVLALGFPTAGIAGQGPVTRALEGDYDHGNFTPWRISEKAQRCGKMYDTCMNFCETNYTKCSSGRSYDVVEARCNGPYHGCRNVCDRNDNICSR